MALLGVYVENSAQRLNQFENWVGRDVDGVHGYVGGSSWGDFVSSSSWAASRLWGPTGTDVFWSVPLITNGASLSAAANGDYNQYYRQVAQNLINADREGDTIYVRTGWEFNGTWMPWSAGGKEGAFVNAFREFVDSFRSVSDRFKFEWNVNESYGGMDPSKAYPGDNYVDIIGMDFYYNPQWQGYGESGREAFEHVRDQKFGLQWLENFAKAHGKPTAYSEWGTQGNDAANFVKAAKEWFDSHNVVYQSYWDSNTSYPGRLSDGSDGSTGSAYKAAFAGGSSAPVEWDSGSDNDTDNDNDNDTDSGSDSGSDAGNETPVVTVPDSGSVSGGATKVSGGWTNQKWGSSGTDTWYGSDANDFYQSNGGGDRMHGGKGDDTYSVFSTNDRAIEKAGEGTDTVTTWIGSYTLGENVENLKFYGTGWSNGTGNGLANIITGNGGKNILDGKGGADLLIGGGNSDTFVIGKGEGGDTIADFRRWEGDKVNFKGFGGGATLTHDGDDWSIRAADGSVTHVKIADVTSLSSGDYIWS
jgi:Ca2+-binding RTX toxin-like protein